VPHPIPAPRRSGTTTTTGLPLYWVRYGDHGDPPTRPTLIILHGGPGADHRYLLPQMLHLAERYDLLLYDQRGSGQSRAENNVPITWRDHVADLGKICHEFGIERPSIVGYSWGAMLALLYTIESANASDNGDLALPHPERLILLSPAPATKAYRAVFDEAMRERGNTPAIVEERQRLMDSGLRERDPEAYRQRIFELGVTAYFADPADAHDLTPFRVVGRVQQSTWESLGDYNLLPSLAQAQSRLRVPSLIVHGRQDPIPSQSSIDIARALNTDVIFIDHCGHVPYVEQPAELWAAVDPFLATTDDPLTS
jgi:proline iminopeptidase